MILQFETFLKILFTLSLLSVKKKEKKITLIVLKIELHLHCLLHMFKGENMFKGRWGCTLLINIQKCVKLTMLSIDQYKRSIFKVQLSITLLKP